ncbi:Predicted metal-dependent hydrolase, TIM-barrel fold [Gracilibacillus orientalis]|uniref:Predicted metal-dependent hydrolase, TIM-barrel fold n=1 Tax=Gracilibacillus orientalis TaxID=334253 RepID=A0A1I4HSC0_9BACI|nr:amidohydrolase family protein [Gracilibacillus orientalis]SFL44710.1 Predicted metal-dependent hydrolase, TIM-barrel fold [Gracilibacillus orientalis]
MQIFDSHLHIIDTRFPLIENKGYIPDAFTSQDYLDSVNNLNVVGGAVVSGSFQEFDQTYLIDALQTLGENFVGVTQLPYDTTDDEIIKLNKLGVRALRFNVNRGGSEDISRLDYFARRVYELVNWHTELYINSNSLKEIATTVEKLPAVSIDHLGLSKNGFSTLLSLVDKGVKVKASGFGRIDFDPGEAIRKIHSINPDALMFGTDLPSTRAKRPFEVSDIELVYKVLEDEQVNKVLYKNAVNWYLK